jgi:hypothetical protein
LRLQAYFSLAFGIFGAYVVGEIKRWEGSPMTITIDRNVEIPVPAKNSGRPPIYPWRKLAIGDSFFAPGKTHQTLGATAGTRGPGIKVTTRAVTENGVSGVRVWRIE